MSTSSTKVMLFGISLILMGILFAITNSAYFEVIDIAFGIFGLMVTLSGLFAKD